MPSTDSDHDRRIDTSTRRTFLLSTGATVALAGCLGDGGDDETTDNGDDDDNTPTPDPEAGTATPEPTADGDDAGDGEYGLSRAEARELLPPESLALRYEPALGNSRPELWAAVVGETDAAAVRTEAASGTYNQVTPQDGTIDGYLGVPVQVDPDGDEVTVLAVDDEGARGPVLTSSVPTDDLPDEAAAEAIPPEALSFSYEPPEAGDFGSLTIEVTAETDAQTLVAQPTEAPGLFADRVGNLADESRIGPGTTLDVAVDPEGDTVRIFASVDGATGEVTRWNGPE
jgi:hypothetical protein